MKKSKEEESDSISDITLFRFFSLEIELMARMSSCESEKSHILDMPRWWSWERAALIAKASAKGSTYEISFNRLILKPITCCQHSSHKYRLKSAFQKNERYYYQRFEIQKANNMSRLSIMYFAFQILSIRYLMLTLSLL